MYAALITGERRVELVEFPDPTPAAAGVVVDVTPTSPEARRPG